jgi:hypothetical protein
VRSKKRSSEEERMRLLEAGWELRLREGLMLWRKPGGGSWYSQRVAMDIVEFLEEEKDGVGPPSPPPREAL